MRPTRCHVASRGTSSRHRAARAPDRRRFDVPRDHRPPGPNRLRLVAAVVLVAGWCAAAVILLQFNAAPDPDAVEYQVVDGHVYPITLAQSRSARQRVERVGGDMNVWIVEFDGLLGSLTRPPRLAWVLLVLSTAIGAGCLGLAKLSAEVDDPSGEGDA